MGDIIFRGVGVRGVGGSVTWVDRTLGGKL